MPEVVVYTKTWCPYCTRAKRLLNAKGIPYREVDVTFDRDAWQEMLARSGGRTTAPQVIIGETHVGGSDELVALDRAGALDRMLDEGE